MDSLVTVLICFFSGILTWTFLEYALHNWVGHIGKGRNAFSRQHLAHHADVTYFAPTSHKLMAAVPVLGLTYLGLSLLLGWQIALGFTGSWALMYSVYEVVHRRSHTHPPKGPYSRWVRRNHLSHHYQNPNFNHGVTSPVFDLIFGTYRDPGKVRIPAKSAPVWMVDAEGNLLPQYAQDYELARRGDRARKQATQASVA